jgi:hypothetical protein
MIDLWYRRRLLGFQAVVCSNAKQWDCIHDGNKGRRPRLSRQSWIESRLREEVVRVLVDDVEGLAVEGGKLKLVGF